MNDYKINSPTTHMLHTSPHAHHTFYDLSNVTLFIGSVSSLLRKTIICDIIFTFLPDVTINTVEFKHIGE